MEFQMISRLCGLGNPDIAYALHSLQKAKANLKGRLHTPNLSIQVRGNNNIGVKGFATPCPGCMTNIPSAL